MKDLVAYNATENNAAVANPFGSDYRECGIGTVQAASHELAEMQAQIYLAKQFPRDQREASEKILTACQRPGLANVAVYSYARGGTNISGPSIRLAEEIARNWGNLECGWNELERNEDSSKLRAFAWDKETNVLKTLFFYVPHYRTTKQGRKRITDERDLYELLANQAARRMRNCILALIPGDVIDAAVEQCQKTMVTHVDISPESIKRLVDAFAGFGVSKAQIEKRIQRRIDAIAPAQFVRMREIYTSLHDGMSSPEDWFEKESSNEESGEIQNPNATAATQSLKAALEASKTPFKNVETEGTSILSPDETNVSNTPKSGKNTKGSKKGSSAPDESPVETFRKKIAACKTEAEIKNVYQEVQADKTLSEEDCAALFHMIDNVATTL